MSRPRILPPFETKMEALSLLYGPPMSWWSRMQWGAASDPRFPMRHGKFSEAAAKVFSEGEIARVGLHRIAQDYAEWYEQQEKANGLVHGLPDKPPDGC